MPYLFFKSMAVLGSAILVVLLGLFLLFKLFGPVFNSNNFVTDKAGDERYTILVLGSDNQPVPNAVVCLDYDPVASYAPPKWRTNQEGKVFLPHKYGAWPGWSWIYAEAPWKGAPYYCRVKRSEVSWPLVLQLMPKADFRNTQPY